MCLKNQKETLYCMISLAYFSIQTARGAVWRIFYEPDIFQLQSCNFIFLDEAGCADIAKFLNVIKYKIVLRE